METSIKNKFKAFTSIEQSKQLAEILPIESADMVYIATDDDEIGDTLYTAEFKSEIILSKDDDDYIQCWSLSALLEQLDDEITDEDGNDYNLTILKEGLQYQLYYHDEWYQAEDIETDWHDDMIDACVEMIIKLKEKGLI